MQIRLRTLIRHITLTAFLAVSAVYWAQEEELSGPLLATTNGQQRSVLLIEANTGRIREFSIGEGIHNVWDFSPDGCHILVTLDSGDGLPQMYIVSLDGDTIRNPISYTDLPQSQWGVWEPDWSSDGSQIAFKMIRDGFNGEPDRQYHIGWVDPTGGEPSFFSVSGREHSPKFSPNGTWLTYLSFDKRAPGADDQSTAEPSVEANTDSDDFIQEADLWVVSADGSTKRRMTGFETGSVRAPRWSPDSQHIGFIYSPSPNNDTLWVVPNDPESRELQLTYGYSLVLEMTWEPSGEIIASARGLGGQASTGLWRLPVSAGADASVSPFIDPDRLPYPDYPAFDSTGTRLAARSAYRVAIVDIAAMSISFVLGADGNMPLMWSPASLVSEANCESN